MRIGSRDDEVVLRRHQIEMVYRHLAQFEWTVDELAGRMADDTLDPRWSEHWRALREFLESEELPGSEIPEKQDGRYCCQWRTRSLHSGQIECHEYVAWYVFACAACTSAAAARGADATLVAGSCSDVQGC